MLPYRRILQAAFAAFASVLACAAAMAAPITISFSGAITQSATFIPGYAPGTSWSLSVSLDTDDIQFVSAIPGSNARYRTPLISGQYNIDGGSATVDELWFTVFNNLPGGADEIDFDVVGSGFSQLLVAMIDSSGNYWSGSGMPNLAAIDLSLFTDGFVRFDEDSPLISGINGGSYRHGTVTALTSRRAVPEPSVFALLILGLSGLMATRSFGRAGSAASIRS